MSLLDRLLGRTPRDRDAVRRTQPEGDVSGDERRRIADAASAMAKDVRLLSEMISSPRELSNAGTNCAHNIERAAAALVSGRDHQGQPITSGDIAWGVARSAQILADTLAQAQQVPWINLDRGTVLQFEKRLDRMHMLVADIEALEPRSVDVSELERHIGEVIARLRDDASVSIPVISRERVQSEYEHVGSAWASNGLGQGTLEEVCALLERNLRRDGELPRFESLSFETHPDQFCAQLDSHFGRAPGSTHGTFKGYRVWRTSEAFFFCGGKDTILE